MRRLIKLADGCGWLAGRVPVAAGYGVRRFTRADSGRQHTFAPAARTVLHRQTLAAPFKAAARLQRRHQRGVHRRSTRHAVVPLMPQSSGRVVMERQFSPLGLANQLHVKQQKVFLEAEALFH